MLNQTMQHLGEAPSVIRETFEYGNALAQKIGRENVYDFSLGNPSTPPPDCVRQTIAALNDMPEQTGLHGYTSAPGDPAVRSAIALDLQKRFGAQTTKLSPLHPSSRNIVYLWRAPVQSLLQ